jgi:hypothetical protein
MHGRTSHRERARLDDAQAEVLDHFRVTRQACIDRVRSRRTTPVGGRRQQQLNPIGRSCVVDDAAELRIVVAVLPRRVIDTAVDHRLGNRQRAVDEGHLVIGKLRWITGRHRNQIVDSDRRIDRGGGREPGPNRIALDDARNGGGDFQLPRVLASVRSSLDAQRPLADNERLRADDRLTEPRRRRERQRQRVRAGGENGPCGQAVLEGALNAARRIELRIAQGRAVLDLRGRRPVDRHQSDDAHSRTVGDE